MLSKKNRADKKAIERIFKEGKSLNGPNFTFRFINTGHKEVKISFIAPKSVAKLAVKRNLLRRRGYTALKKYISQFPAGLMGAFVFKKYQDDRLVMFLMLMAQWDKHDYGCHFGEHVMEQSLTFMFKVETIYSTCVMVL